MRVPIKPQSILRKYSAGAKDSLTGRSGNSKAFFTRADRRDGPKGAALTKTPGKRPSPSGAVVGPRREQARKVPFCSRQCRSVQDMERLGGLAREVPFRPRRGQAP